MVDVAAALSEKLAALALSAEELAVLDRMLASAVSRADADVEPVVEDDLIPSAVQRAIVSRTAKALRTDLATSRAAFADALTFLEASSRHYGVSLSPSPKVDEAWHQFLIFSVEYARYCDRVAGHFIHHVPNLGRGPRVVPALGWPETYGFLTARGHSLDADLWAIPTARDSVAHLH